ncbi:hypothetical protein HanRHA438_Chr09g0414711 [Helianthus annuus]|nr:hypothetical protein HanRHA438_Chr09g0414711 [Helianthus annuus]
MFFPLDFFAELVASDSLQEPYWASINMVAFVARQLREGRLFKLVEQTVSPPIDLLPPVC